MKRALLIIAALGGVAHAQPDAAGSGSSDPNQIPSEPEAPQPKPPPPTEPASTPAPLQAPSTTNTLTQDSSSPNGGVEVGGFKFAFHGYARMPLSTTGTRQPYLVDNDYYLSGFAYTRLYESDWSELRFSATKGDYTAEFAIFSTLYSDDAQADITDQLGITQASVTGHRFLGVPGLTTQVGVFWDRYGYIEPYDTYIFGRTHQGGAKLAYDLPGGGRVQAGIGMHQAELQQNEGTTPLVHIAVTEPIPTPAGPIDVAAYYLREWTHDKPQLSPIQDAEMYVAGADASYRLPHNLGSAYLAFAYYHMENAIFLAPVLEVLHSTGGQGITENFLGTTASDNGTGHMIVGGADIKLRLTDLAGLRLFGIGTWVHSPQVDEANPLDNYDRRLYFKWGAEPSYMITKRIRASLRYDRVIMDVYDSQNAFHVLSPKIAFPFDNWGEIFLQYSHYWYGDKVELRPGQVPLETEPDSNVFKIQAQVVW
ncbi:MAG TPA: hypothetical protein VH143_18115 [Kofleriaceae bacterium]|jgi:hypothetical protein|nr:hypothetical protein [Kofleriaceae bacterium]